MRRLIVQQQIALTMSPSLSLVFARRGAFLGRDSSSLYSFMEGEWPCPPIRLWPKFHINANEFIRGRLWRWQVFRWDDLLRKVGWVSLCWTHQHYATLTLAFCFIFPKQWKAHLRFERIRPWQWLKEKLAATQQQYFCKKKKEDTWQTVFIALLFNYLCCYSHACKG